MEAEGGGDTDQAWSHQGGSTLPESSGPAGTERQRTHQHVGGEAHCTAVVRVHHQVAICGNYSVNLAGDKHQRHDMKTEKN